jgi:acetylornithine deacetylase/succinyl-diaminopimelate desuccinylase-like protein
MSAAGDIEVQATELLRTLIRNRCVNTGEESSGHEDRSCDALEAFFAGSGLSCERYTSAPGRVSLITRVEGSDGFGLHSTRIPYTEYPAMFHGHNERVDSESLRLSAEMWEALCRDFLG